MNLNVKLVVLTFSTVTILSISGCGKSEAKKTSAGMSAQLVTVPASTASTGAKAAATPQLTLGAGAPGLGTLTQQHIAKCQAIKDANKDISTLNYELQNAGCTLVDVTTYRKK